MNSRLFNWLHLLSPKPYIPSKQYDDEHDTITCARIGKYARTLRNRASYQDPKLPLKMIGEYIDCEDEEE